jgi:hypothetical protein
VVLIHLSTHLWSLLLLPLKISTSNCSLSNNSLRIKIILLLWTQKLHCFLTSPIPIHFTRSTGLPLSQTILGDFLFKLHFSHPATGFCPAAVLQLPILQSVVFSYLPVFLPNMRLDETSCHRLFSLDGLCLLGTTPSCPTCVHGCSKLCSTRGLHLICRQWCQSPLDFSTRESSHPRTIHWF